MRARLTSILTILGLVAGTGGALAIATGGGHSSHGASTAQYKPGKGCGKGHKPNPKCHHHHHHGTGVSGQGKHKGGGGGSGVLGQQQQRGTSGSGVAGEGTTQEVSLRSTTSSGSLPFTGEDLLKVALIGLLLAGIGFAVSLRIRRT